MTKEQSSGSVVQEIRANNLRDCFSKKDGLPGVYCWGYYEDDTFIPLYVGKSRNVHERLLQHYCRFKSGEYQLFDPDELRDIYINKTSTIDELKPVYEPLCFLSVIENFPSVKEIDKMIKNFAFRFIHVHEEADRVNAERSLANHIGRGRLITNVSAGGDCSLSDELMPLVSSGLGK